jgi:glucose-1-phosphate adenylyltransferase
MQTAKPKVLALVMAGGKGTRLHPLTADCCKPALPFGSRHRIVDFVLSNLVNSQVDAIYLLVQHQSLALIEHVRDTWTWPRLNSRCTVTIVPPQLRDGNESYQGTADAIAQNLQLVEAHAPDVVAVFAADHVYRMDVRQMVDEHLARAADVSVASVPVPVQECSSVGVVETDAAGWVRRFHEKPQVVRAMPGFGGMALASMGNYVFSAAALMRELSRARHPSEVDFGRHTLPRLVESHRVLAHDFMNNRVPGPQEAARYWRDVGSVDAYFEAHADTLGVDAPFPLANPAWPIHSGSSADEAALVEGGAITRSSIGAGCVVRAARLDHALLRCGVRAEDDARVEHSIVMDRVFVGRGARLMRTIVDRDNHIPPHEVIGGNPERDRRRFHVSRSGVVVVPAGHFRRPAT